MKIGFFKVTALMLGGMVSMTPVVAAEKAYKWVEEDGSVVFSSAPPSNGIEAQEIQLPDRAPASSRRAPPPPRQYNDQSLQTIDRSIDRRRRQRDALLLELSQAESALKSAQVALEQGRTPMAGERKPSAIQGRSRLTAEYFSRVRGLEDAVAKAEANVQRVREALKQLR